jgi:hypothetical protein
MNIPIASPALASRIDCEAFCGGKFARALLANNINVSIIAATRASSPHCEPTGHRAPTVHILRRVDEN